MSFSNRRRRVENLMRSASEYGRRALLGSILLSAASGCAKVGDPLPPAPQPPPTAQNLRANKAAGQTTLVFTLPAKDVQWVEIYRQCDLRSPVARLELFARIAWTELQESGQAGVFSWEDRSADAMDCRYALRFVNQWGLRSEYSNVAR